MPMVNKLGKLVTCHEGHPSIILLQPFSRGLARSRVKLKPLYIRNQISKAIKLGRMVTYLNCLLLIQSYDLIMTWFC